MVAVIEAVELKWATGGLNDGFEGEGKRCTRQGEKEVEYAQDVTLVCWLAVRFRKWISQIDNLRRFVLWNDGRCAADDPRQTSKKHGLGLQGASWQIQPKCDPKCLLHQQKTDLTPIR